MPYVPIAAAGRAAQAAEADARWTSILAERPELEGAVTLQRSLISRILTLQNRLEQTRMPRLSLPGGYLAAKLARGVPVLAGEPIPLPIAELTAALLGLCRDLATGGAAEAAEHVRAELESGRLDAGSLLSASLARDQDAIRTGAAHRGLSADLVWLAAELAVCPFAYMLQRTLFAAAASPAPSSPSSPLVSALERWNHGYCPACGSWPAMAEVADGHRVLRCSFCAAGWELPTYACVYCSEDQKAFVTAAPNQDRKDRRVEVCGTCHGYLKTVDTFALSPFPLLALGDLETMDLDMAAMEHGYQRPSLKAFGSKR